MVPMMMAAFLALAPADGPPAALVLFVRGDVQVRPAEGGPLVARSKTLLYPGDRLIVPAGAEVTLAFREGGARERLKPGVEATVGARGCTPTEAVERREAGGAAVSASLRDIKPSGGDGRTASTTLRGDDTVPTVASDRPGLSWPASAGAATYVVVLSTGTRAAGPGRELWRAEVAAPRLPFPEGEPPLRRGYPYQWKVTDRDSRELASGDFAVAAGSQKRRMDELAELAAGDDPADVLLAAEALEGMGVEAEALAAFERLSKLLPEDAAAREAVARLRRRAGR